MCEELNASHLTQEDLALGECAACGEPVSGNYAIHRDGFGEGPEVDICDDCGSGPMPSCEELWEMIAERGGRRG